MRQKLAFIALGVTLPVSYYTTLRNVDLMDEVDMAEQGADLMEVQPEAELPDATRVQVIENKDQHLMEKATKTI